MAAYLSGATPRYLLKVLFSQSFTHHWWSHQELAVLCFEMQPERYIKPQTVQLVDEQLLLRWDTGSLGN